MSRKGHPDAYYAFADSGDVSVRISLLPDSPYFYIQHSVQFGRSFRFGQLNYALDGNNYSYTLKRFPEYIDRSESFDETHPETVWLVGSPAGPLGDDVAVSNNKDRVYEVRMEFTLDDKLYVFKVAYQIDRDYWYTFGIPGTGP